MAFEAQQLHTLQQNVDQLAERLTDLQSMHANRFATGADWEASLATALMEDDAVHHITTVHGVQVEYNDNVRIRVGPIIGRVTHDSAIVLLEVDCEARITLHAFTHGVLKKQYAQYMPANRPRAFVLANLEPKTTYTLAFSGVSKANTKARVGKFTTLALRPHNLRVAVVSCDKAPALHDGEANLWERISVAVGRNDLDYVLHCGNQVYSSRAFGDACALFRQHEASRSPTSSAETISPRVEELVKERLRESYRFAWNLPFVRQVMASVPHLMIWADRDIHRNFTTPAQDDHTAVEPRVVHMAQQVYREYQRQLWDPFYELAEGSAEQHFHGFGAFGILFLDLRGNRVTTTGDLHPEGPLLSNAQWQWIEECLATEDLQTLLVISEWPLAGVSFDDVSRNHASPLPASLWPPELLVRFMDAVFMWKKARRGREVVLVAGGTRAGLETALHDTITLQSIRQICASPITNRPRSFCGRLTGQISDRFSFKHTPMTDQRCYGMCTLYSGIQDVGKTEVRLVGNFEMTVRAVVGPIVGRVTARTATILLEVYSKASVTCVLTDDDAPDKRFVCAELLPPGEPRSFYFDTLEPGHRYSAVFMGINNPFERRARFQTPLLQPDALRFLFVSGDRPEQLEGEVNLWQRVSAHAISQSPAPVALVHLGSQVSSGKPLEDAWTLLRRNLLPGLTETQKENLNTQVKDLLRGAYRFAWNLPFAREALSTMPHLMQWSDTDVYPNFTASRARSSLSPSMLALAMQVFHEYQTALWAGSESQCVTSYSVHQWDAVSLFIMDIRGNRITREGNLQPENAAVGEDQWDALQGTLDSTNLKVLILCCEYPFIANNPAEAHDLLPPGTDSESHWDYWPCHTADLCRLLAMIFDWMNIDPKNRRVILLGGMYAAAESLITDSKTKLEVQHISVGPITARPHPYRCRLEGALDGRFAYVHRPFDHQRCFVTVDVWLRPEVKLRARLVTDGEPWAEQSAPRASISSAEPASSLPPLRESRTPSRSSDGLEPRPSSAPAGKFAGISPLRSGNTPKKLEFATPSTVRQTCPVSVVGKHKMHGGICKLCGMSENWRPSNTPSKTIQEHAGKVIEELDDFDLDFDRLRMKKEYLKLLDHITQRDADAAQQIAAVRQEMADREQSLLNSLKERDEHIRKIEEQMQKQWEAVASLQQKLTIATATVAVTNSPILNPGGFVVRPLSAPVLPRQLSQSEQPSINESLPSLNDAPPSRSKLAARTRATFAASEEKFRPLFERLDDEQRGSIRKDVFLRFVGSVSPFGSDDPLRYATLQPILRTMNTAGPQRLSYEEFAILMLKLEQL